LEHPLKFRIVEDSSASSGGDEILLALDPWNDWFVWKTQFFAVYVDGTGKRTELGQVKVGRLGMNEKNSVSHELMEHHFSRLSAPWFSIGQSEDYYQQLIELGDTFREQYLTAMRDLAFDPVTLEEVEGESVVMRSLLRGISDERVRNRLNRLAHGNAALSSYDFSFSFPMDSESNAPPPVMDFLVVPHSTPPTNVHVIIGQNGAGKSRCFDLMSRTLLGLRARGGAEPGKITRAGKELSPFMLSWDDQEFAGLVNVSFSPFEDYGPLLPADGENDFRYAYVGLIRESAVEIERREAPATILSPQDQIQSQTPTIKGRLELANDFVDALKECRLPGRRKRWLSAIELLEADTILRDTGARGMIDDENEGSEQRISS
jgi:hypothetical protein